MLIKGRGGTRETLILEPVRVAAIVELESGSFEKYLKSTGGLGVFLSIFQFSKFGNVCEGVILEGLLVILNLDEQTSGEKNITTSTYGAHLVPVAPL